MSCSQTLAGIVRDCVPSMGGIKEVYIANHEDVSSIELSGEKISAITMASPAKFYRYAFRTGAATMTSTLTTDVVGGVSYVVTDLVLQFNRMETTKKVEMKALSQGDLAVIVLDNNGVYWYLGKDEPVIASAGDGQTGAGRGDANRYTITLQDNSKEFPCEVEGSIVDALISE